MRHKTDETQVFCLLIEDPDPGDPKTTDPETAFKV